MILHTCDTPRCVRNDDRGTYKVSDRLLPRWGHLFLGTHADNMADMRAKGRGATGEQNGAHTHPEAFLRGAASPTAKLTDAAVRAILKGRAQGVPLQVLADQYGVSDSTISRVALRQTYRERR